MTDATLLRRYHAALSEARTNDQLTNYHIDFWFQQGDVGTETWPAGIKAIRLAHRQRVRGEGSPAACDTALNEALRSIGQ